MQTVALCVWTSDFQPQSELVREARSIGETEDKGWFLLPSSLLSDEDSRGRAEHLNLEFPAQLQTPLLLSLKFYLDISKELFGPTGTTVGWIDITNVVVSCHLQFGWATDDHKII